MTEIKFCKKNNQLCGFCISGHSSVDSDDFEGKIVCSAISSAAYMTANTITEIIGAKAEIKVTEAFMSLKVTTGNEKVNAVLEGFKLHAEGLEAQYKNNIKLSSEV